MHMPTSAASPVDHRRGVNVERAPPTNRAIHPAVTKSGDLAEDQQIGRQRPTMGFPLRMCLLACRMIVRTILELSSLVGKEAVKY
jgi:hypothetical protein